MHKVNEFEPGCMAWKKDGLDGFGNAVTRVEYRQADILGVNAHPVKDDRIPAVGRLQINTGFVMFDQWSIIPQGSRLMLTPVSAGPAYAA